MTYGELKREVRELGFTDTEISDTSLTLALGRALAVAYTERGVLKEKRLFIPNIKRRELFSSMTHKGGATERYPLKGAAYAATVSGEGSYKISDSLGEREESFSGDGISIKGILTGDGEIEFSGEYSYTVYRLSTYDAIISPDPEKIFSPSKMRVINLSEYGIRLLGAASDVRDGEGVLIEGAIAIGERLYIPEDYFGEVVILYREAPPELSPDTPDEPLDIPTELCHLIPLLAASYVWLDDEPERAQYYAALYRDGMSALKIYLPRRLSETPEDVTGWAK